MSRNESGQNRQRYYVGGRDYAKTGEGNSSTGWEICVPTASQVRNYEKTTNVRTLAGQLFALPGVHSDDARRYHAIDSLAQISGLLSYSFGLLENVLAVNDPTSFAVRFSTDSAGRLVSLAITSDSSYMRLSIDDAFTYNRPVTIEAP